MLGNCSAAAQRYTLALPSRLCILSLFQCLQSLCDLRLSPHFPHTAALDQAVGAAVTSMGPEVVLQAVPLEIDGSE